MLGIVLAVWSLVFLGDDLGYCKWPASASVRQSSNTVCTVELPSGKAVPSGGFAHDCAAQTATGWNDHDVSFAQRIERREVNFLSDAMLMDDGR